MADPLKSWERLHTAGEKQLAATLASYFKSQAQRVVDAVKDYGMITTDDVAEVFDPADEHTELITAIKDDMLGFMATGAERM